MARERRGEPEAVRITSAAESRNADIAVRQKRYLLSMSLRTICFVGAIIVSLAGGPTWVWVVLIAGALVLPYVAVVMANAASTKGDGFALVDHGPGHRELGPGPRPR